MKKTTFFIFMLSSFTKLEAQVTVSKESIKGTPLHYYLKSNGIYFENKTGVGGFYPNTDKFPCKSTIYTAGLWAYAETSSTSGTYKATAATVSKPKMSVTNRKGESEFTSGPINSNLPQAWAKIWKVEHDEIQKAVSSYHEEQPEKILQLKNIMNWPAYGNSYSEKINGFIPSQDLSAPFFDRDADGLYNPLKGDLPAPSDCSFLPIKFITWSLSNDFQAPHNLSKADPLGIEVATTSFIYLENNNQESGLNPIFIRFDVVNRSNNQYQNFKLGQYIDFDLGNPSDDLLAYNSTFNSIVAYNGDENDEESSGGFGMYKPIHCILPLSPVTSLNNIIGIPDYTNLFLNSEKLNPSIPNLLVSKQSTDVQAFVLHHIGPFDKGQKTSLTFAHFAEVLAPKEPITIPLFLAKASSVLTSIQKSCEVLLVGDEVIRLFPNPTNSGLTISSDLPIQHIEFLDFMGKIYPLDWHQQTSTIDYKIDDLNAFLPNTGLYYAKIHCKNGQIISKPFSFIK